MAEKKVIGNLKLRIPAGRATAGPPVGSTLGQWGLNMMDFIRNRYSFIMCMVLRFTVFSV